MSDEPRVTTSHLRKRLAAAGFAMAESIDTYEWWEWYGADKIHMTRVGLERAADGHALPAEVAMVRDRIGWHARGVTTTYPIPEEHRGIGFKITHVPFPASRRCRTDLPALSVKCPECSAYVGERCRDAWGEFAIAKAHASRYAAELKAADEAKALAAQIEASTTDVCPDGGNMARVYAVFHRMWGKAKDAPGYVKGEWMAIDRMLTVGVVDEHVERFLDRAEREQP